LYRGAEAPATAILEANSRAQAFTESVRGEASETTGDKAAAETIASAMTETFMWYSLVAKNTNAPASP
jgi:hypothetical protein